jgi:hypothetical protein
MFFREHHTSIPESLMSDKSRLMHHASLHAFFMAAKEREYTRFQVQLSTNAEGRMEFRISSQRPSKMSANFEVRGNMVRCRRERYKLRLNHAG